MTKSNIHIMGTQERRKIKEENKKAIQRNRKEVIPNPPYGKSWRLRGI